MSTPSLDRALAHKASKWTGLVTKNPARVVAALKIGPLGPKHRATNEFGDTGEDFIFAMDAVKKVTEALGRGGTSNLDEEHKKWEGLVNAGAVEALCRNVCELKADTMAEDAMSSYYPPFVMLYFAAIGIRSKGSESDSLSGTDKRVLAVIRDNWRDMINRWWSEPQNSLKDITHEPERLVVSRLLGHLLIHDSSVYEIIFHPSDNTLALISRHWAHSITPTVARSTVVILRSILLFNFSANIEEYLESHEKPSLSFLMSKVYAGLGSDKPEALLDVMSSRLALRESGGGAEEAVEYAVQDLAFSHDLYVNLDPAFGEALRRAEGYWKNAFELMLPTASSSPSSSSDTNPPADALDAPASTQLSQAALTLLLKLVLQKPDSEVAEVTQTWIRAGLFDMFDKNMGAVVRAPGAARLLTFLFTSIKESAFNFPPELLSLLKDELPRQKTVAAVIKYDMELQGAVGGDSAQGDKNQLAKTRGRTFGEGTDPDEIPDAQDPLWANGLWQAIGWLQGLCHSPTPDVCMRRTCGKKAESRCSGCKQVGYCGAECQKLDWKEHKPLCKWAAPYMEAVSKGEKRITREKAVEMGLIGPGAGLEGAGEAGTTTAIDRLKSLSDYVTPVMFLVLVVAGQYLGIFDDVGRWVSERFRGSA